MKKTLLSFLGVCLMAAAMVTNQAVAVPAYPGLIKYEQANGKIINIYLKGDEKVKWVLSEDGYTLMLNSKGVYEYAFQDGKGDITLSGVEANNPAERTKAEREFLGKVSKGLYYSPSQLSLMKSIWEIKSAESLKAFPTTGNRKLICILMGFKDKAFTKTQSDFNNLFNQVGYTTGGATGSVKDFYMENSWSQFNLTVDVFGPYTSSQNMSYYGANDASGYDVNPRALVTEAVNAADASANYANYDNDGDGTVDGVYVIYAGYGEEAGASADCIWAHAWSITPVTKDGKTISKYSCSSELRGTSGTTITAIGVICHEFGHVLGAPDYYDTDYSTGGQYEGTGYWDLMASGSWNNNGVTPAHHNAYTKVKVYGWATATVLSSAATISVTNAEANKSFYQINSTTTNEYWIMENRQQVGFDANIPGHGLLIYHVHKDIATASSSNNINATYPQKMYPVCASATTNPGSTPSSYGSISSTGCPWPGSSSKTSFTDATTPNMKSWAGANTAKPMTNIAENTSTKTVTFDFMGGSGGGTAPTATTLAASAISTSSATLNGQVNANNATTTVTFEWGTTTSLGSSFSATPSSVTGTTTTNVTGNLTGLSANTTYYFRVKAVNASGTTYGSTLNFTTSSTPTSITLPVTENFNSSTLPTGWTTQNTGTSITERWSVSNTYKAGGSAYEMKCTYQNVNPGTTRLITPAINTVGVSQVTLSFKHMLDAYGSGATLRVQTSNNKSTWTNTTWSVATGSSNVGPATVTVNITSNLNSETTYIAFVVDGNLYQIDYWYVDNVSITAGSGATIPTVTTNSVTSITSSSALCGGNVTSDGGATVTERGICYSTSQNPTTSSSKVTSGTGTGSFTANMTGLSASTTYYVRAYAINAQGTAYGAQQSFTTLSGSTSLPLPVTQTFNTSSLPTGWTTQNTGTSITERWSVSNTYKAGGSAYEMKCTWQNVNPGTTRLITPAINTVGVSQVTLTFKHFLDAYSTGATLRVQTSNNKSTWTNTTWSVATSSTNVGPATVTVNITSNLNSETTYIAFVVDGNLYNIDYWYVDNVSIVASGSGSPAFDTPISDLTENDGVKIFNLYPNPASDYINISLTGASSEVTVRIFDVRGSMVKSQVLNASENRIDVSTLAKGIYMVSVGEGKEISTKRFIKQ